LSNKEEREDMSKLCPVCRSETSEFKDVAISSLGLHGSYCSCPRCGEYQIESFTVAQVKDLRLNLQTMAVLSHWIRTEYESIKRGSREDPIILTGELVQDIIKNPRPSLPEQADYYIRWIGDNVKVGGQYTGVHPLAIQAVVGSATIEEFELVSSHLRDARLINHGSGAGAWRDVTLSFAGWKYYRKLERATGDSRRAFMAMEYNREPLEGVVDRVFRNAVRQTGFDLFLLRDRPVAGLIDNRLRAEIQAARFLIADLTDRNPGAYWEAGYAEGLGKPVIYTCEKGVFEDSKRKPHFDTNHHQTVLWSAGDPKTTASDLKATIRATLPAVARATDD
jgi:hypothetical protein